MHAPYIRTADRTCAEESPKAARTATINGVTVYPYYSLKSWRGQTYGLMAVSRLADIFPITPSGGLYMCLALDRRSTCGTPQALCYGGSCVHSLFDADMTCCPADQASFV